MPNAPFTLPKNSARFLLDPSWQCELLVNKEKHEIRRIGNYTAMIREQGMIPGLSAHMPELIVYSDENGYDVETYIQIYNCMDSSCRLRSKRSTALSATPKSRS